MVFGDLAHVLFLKNRLRSVDKVVCDFVVFPLVAPTSTPHRSCLYVICLRLCVGCSMGQSQLMAYWQGWCAT